jgi:CheY-like chemotaxis protein
MRVLPHVLIVDDDADLRSALSFSLQSEGHSVSEAANGRLALDALASGPPIALIILDLMMPVMDGIAFLAQKARGPGRAIPVVIFSSSPSTGLVGLAGVFSMVSKLEGSEGLLAAVRLAERSGSGPYAPAGEFHA